MAISFLTPGATKDQRTDILKTLNSLMKLGEKDQAKSYVKRVARSVAPQIEQGH